MNLKPLSIKWSLVRYRMLYDVFQTMQRVVCCQHLKSDYQIKSCAVLDLLQEKHQCIQKADLKYVVRDLKNWHLQFNPSIFVKFRGSETKRAAMKTNGSHGPAGFGAGEWRRLLISYKSSSIDCRKTLSKIAVRIVNEESWLRITLVVWLN